TDDNGTARIRPSQGTVHGKPISGQKGSMLEGGSRVPLIVNFKGITAEGTTCADLIDFSDFFPTFAELAHAPIPANLTLDGHSFAPQIHGQPGQPRPWVYVELSGNYYIRSPQWKLTNTGALFNMKNAPYEEIPTPTNTTDPAALAARKELQQSLTTLRDASALPTDPQSPTTDKKTLRKQQRQQRRAAARRKP